MKVIIEAEKEKINTISNQVQTFRETFLRWSIDNESPANYPADILWFLRVFDEIGSHFNDIMNKLWDMEKQPDETHCQTCTEKDKTIQLLEQEVLSNKRVIEAQHKAIFGQNNHLTVCEK